MLVPNPETSWVVAEIYQLYSTGWGDLNIADYLNGKLVKPPGTSDVWTRQTVKWILQNPFYSGKVVHGRTKANQRNTHRPLTEPIVAQGKHQGLIDSDLWETCQRIRGSRRDLHPRQRDAVYPFSGVLRCAHCGGPMGAAKWWWDLKDGQRRYAFAYRCLKWIHAKACIVDAQRQEHVEAKWLEALDGLNHPEGLGSFLTEQNRGMRERYDAAVASKRQIEKQLQTSKENLRVLRRKWVESNGKLSDAEYEEMKAEYLSEIATHEKEIAKPLPDRGEAIDYGMLTEMTRQVRDNWPYMEIEERKAFILNFCNLWKIRPFIFQDGTMELRYVGQDHADSDGQVDLAAD